VREPAPIFSGAEPVVLPMPPQPAPPTMIVSNADEANKPRRTGWWAKRLMGGDKG
jgi:ribonuclease E